ncbi:hypothetical protein ES703_103271 [subsurface metagenome]
MTLRISIHQICRYDFETDSWTFSCDVGVDKEAIAREENYCAFLSFKKELKKLSQKFPMEKCIVRLPFYSKVRD